MKAEMSRTRTLEARVPPPVLMMGTGLAMWALSHFSPRFSLPSPLAWLAPSLLALMSVSLIFSAALSFRRSATTIDPTRPAAASRLVTGGVYRLTRNPMYVGFAGLLLAWGLYLQAWLPLPLPLAFVLYLGRFQIRPEERALQAKFGAAFEAYAESVRRWL